MAASAHVKGVSLRRGPPWWFFSAAVLYQTALLGGTAGAGVLALTTCMDRLDYRDLAGYPTWIEAPATVFVATIILWHLLLLCLSHTWRNREHLTEPQIWGRLLVLCLPVYGAVCAYRLSRRERAMGRLEAMEARRRSRIAELMQGLHRPGGPGSPARLNRPYGRYVAEVLSRGSSGYPRSVGDWCKAVGPWAVFVVVVGGAALWFFTMPYPFADWWHAQFGVRYDSTWPVSREDYEEVTRLVRQRLDWRDLITDVSVRGPDEVRVRTLEEFHGCWAWGMAFTAKRADGRWVLENSAW
jgi:hypothetical protein